MENRLACGGCKYFCPTIIVEKNVPCDNVPLTVDVTIAGPRLCIHPKNVRYDDTEPSAMPTSHWNLHGFCTEHTTRKSKSD